jgi:threonine dehydratase
MGDLTWPIIRDKVDAAVVVSEHEIVDAMRMVFERMKVMLQLSSSKPRHILVPMPNRLTSCA